MSAVGNALPYLPQGVVRLKRYRYDKKKLVGKGPEEEDFTFIMPMACIQRDLSCNAFRKSLECKLTMILHVPVYHGCISSRE